MGQVVLAFGAGTGPLPRAADDGELIWAMLIHGLWDFAAFIGSGAVVLSPVLVIANGLLGLTLVAFPLRTTSGRKLEQFGASRLLDA